MPVVDGHVPPAPLPFHRGHMTLAMPDLDRLGIEPQIDLFADQPRADRVGVLGGTNGREAPHLHPFATEVLDPHRRGRLHSPQILAEQGDPPFPPRANLAQETRLPTPNARRPSSPAPDPASPPP